MDKIAEKELPVLFFRLINGDDLISEINIENKKCFSLKNPMRILVDADLEAGKQTIYMHSWLPQGIISNNTCDLVKKDILFTGTLEADIEEYYRGMVVEIFAERIIPKPKNKNEKEYIDSERKIISFNKNLNKDT